MCIVHAHGPEDLDAVLSGKVDDHLQGIRPAADQVSGDVISKDSLSGGEDLADPCGMRKAAESPRRRIVDYGVDL